MFVSPNEVPPNRREAHQRALDLLDRYESTEQSFALVLRTYLVTQLFGEAPEGFRATQLFENILHDELALLGLGAITVQAQGVGTEQFFLADEDTVNREFEVCSPALYMRTEGWSTTVEYLIARAGLVVVLLQAATPGALQELESIVALGRADHTVIVLFESNFTDPLPELPILERFLRVIFGHELDPPRVVDHFLLKDLVDAMCAGRTSQPPETDWRSVAAGYEQLARSERGRRALSDAAVSYGRAARISLRSDDHLGAVHQTIAQATVLDQLGDAAKARDVMHGVANAVPVSTGGETGRARAELDAAVARQMAADGEALGALDLLDQSRRRADERDDPRSASVLQTASAWIRRCNLDVLGAMGAAREAVALADRAGAGAELWRSLIVLGILWGDLGEWSPLGSDAIARAVGVMPESGAEEDLWMVLMTLGRLATKTRDWSTAARAYMAAAQAGTAADLPAEARTARESLLTALAEKRRAQ